MTTKILEDIKVPLGVGVNNLGFDQELLLLLNSVKANLVQLGISDFDLIYIDANTVWPDLLNESLMGMVKHYMVLKTKQSFDPRPSQTIADVVADTLIMLEGRIATAVSELGLITEDGLFHGHTADEIDGLLVYVESLINELGVYTAAEVDATIDANIAAHAGTNTHAQIDTHIANQSNPHGVDLADVGGAAAVHGHVESDITNLDKYTQAEVDAAIAAVDAADVGASPLGHGHTEVDISDLDKYTQAEVDAAIDADIATHAGTNTHAQIDTHLAATNNPHSVTPSQIGAAEDTHASNHTDGTDDIQDATASQKGLATAAQITKLDGIETNADVTDAANVAAAGAMMEDADILQKTAAYQLASGDNAKTIYCSGTFTITLPDGLVTGFQVFIVNKGTGTITLSAATTLNSEGSAVTLPNQYGGATVQHEGSNVWYAWGGLE